LINKYLERYGFPEAQFKDYRLPHSVDIIVVIPCYKEETLDITLECLDNCNSTGLNILVLIIVNESEKSEVSDMKTNLETLNYLEKASFRSFKLKYCHTKLPKKKAGVGLARKIGMDEAVRFFDKNDTSGIIACFDADSTCELNYFQAISAFFRDTVNHLGLVYYEHSLNGVHENHIIAYELFLRYYTDGLRYTCFPYAFQTLGSCIVVKSDAYQKYGGMSPRQAGEDFYFINKIAMHGNTGEVNDTIIYPSNRVSDRVPFGTGHAIGNMEKGVRRNEVYNPKIFIIIKDLISAILSFRKSDYHELIAPFLTTIEFEMHITRIKKESKDTEQFENRLFQWLDAFKILKLTHFLDALFDRVPIDQGIDWLNINYYQSKHSHQNFKERLLAVRQYNRENKLN
jgi:hypothetical protein